MKVTEAVKRAAVLTGRPEMPCFENTAGSLKKIIPVINAVLNELETGISVSSPESRINLSHDLENALCYGVAAYTARNVGDADSYAYLIKMYSSYRNRAFSKKSEIKDVFPRAW